MYRTNHAKEAVTRDEDRDGGEHQGHHDDDDHRDDAPEQAQEHEDEDMPDIAAMLNMTEAKRLRLEGSTGGGRSIDGRNGNHNHHEQAGHHEHDHNHAHHGHARPPSGILGQSTLPSSYSHVHTNSHAHTNTHAPSHSHSHSHSQQPQQSQSQQQFTWVMETGRGEPATTLHPATSSSLPPHLLYQQLLGASGPTIPLHFQHLLAASSLLWPAMGHNGHYVPNHHHHQHLSGAGRSMLPLKRCSNCGATSTPSWRRCPAGKDLLCNACGLYQKLHGRPRPFRIADDGTIRVQRTTNHGGNGHGHNSNSNSFVAIEEKVCANCATSDTPLWRRLEQHNYCNACALFFKTHGYHRPLMSTATAVVTEEDGSTPDSFTMGGPDSN